jgi:hypothetical protein
MSDRKTESIKLIGNSYQIVKPLFQVGSYFYAQGKIPLTQSAASPTTMRSLTPHL